MSLLMPLPGGVKTQNFGPSAMSIQPAMWHIGTDRAWWSPIPGSVWNENVHAGTDFAGKPAGSPLVAAEAGIVTRADYDRYNGGGWVIEVEIRPGVRYSYNHCQSLLRWVGARVARGETIARVGATGTILQNGQFVRSTYGVHVHVVLTITTTIATGFVRDLLYDFADFMYGGSKAASSLVKPPTTTSYPKKRVRYPVNMRNTPDLDVGANNIIYANRADGLYNRIGTRLGSHGTVWEARGSTVNDDGTWRKLYRSGLGYCWVKNELIY